MKSLLGLCPVPLIVAVAAVWLLPGPKPAAVSQPGKTGRAPQVTFSRDIAPIIYGNCATCHHAGQVAPFSLASYHDAAKRSQLIAFVTHSGYMPPWHAAPRYADFKGARRLTSRQIALLARWSAEGAPEGDPKREPPPPKFDSDWQLGAPDAIFGPKASYHLAADGNDVYRCFVISTSYPADRYLRAIEVQPGNRRVVHHVIAYLDTTGVARKLAGDDPAGGYTSFGGPGFSAAGTLGGWAPGMDPLTVPDGDGIRLPKGADIVLQVHYHKDGKPETDRTRIGLYFTQKPVDKDVYVGAVADHFLRIPAGDADYTANASLPILANITLLGIMPHMHLLGRDMTVWATLPSGANLPLVKVPNWDFNWQTIYMYSQPVRLPKGSRVDLVAHYDNSGNNPRNPNIPPKAVTWGEQTTDEMCIAFFFFTVDSEHIASGHPWRGTSGP